MDQDTPAVPPVVRTVAYLVGLTFGLAVAPALMAFDLIAWAAVAVAISGAANAVAFGYRPTRTDGA